jgi:hypothetical protein
MVDIDVHEVINIECFISWSGRVYAGCVLHYTTLTPFCTRAQCSRHPAYTRPDQETKQAILITTVELGYNVIKGT